MNYADKLLLLALAIISAYIIVDGKSEVLAVPLRIEARVSTGLSILLFLGLVYGSWRVAETRRRG